MDLLVLIGTLLIWISFDNIFVKLGVLLSIVIYGDIKIRNKTASKLLVGIYFVSILILIFVFALGVGSFLYDYKIS